MIKQSSEPVAGSIAVLSGSHRLVNGDHDPLHLVRATMEDNGSAVAERLGLFVRIDRSMGVPDFASCLFLME
ncbi:MAG: hypothetical protein HKN70_00115 [Gammaproteobacteria bacterium]|nr:hypothetical protein [Gammaproteobacteria bacterium]